MLSTVHRKFTALYACADFIRLPGAKNSFQIAEGLRDSKDLRRAVARMRQDKEFNTLCRERYLRGFPDIDTLIQLPAGTLGHEYAKNMRKLNLGYDVYPPVHVADDVTYFLQRGRETHDVWHTVTGFPPDVPGELGLQAFQLAQLHVPVSKVLLGLGVLRTTFFPDALEPVFDAVVRGWQMGKTAPLFIGQRWEDGWDRPLQQWRKDLRLAA
jgi:ubiquinone biosynthesis protein COQ4